MSRGGMCLMDGLRVGGIGMDDEWPFVMGKGPRHRRAPCQGPPGAKSRGIHSCETNDEGTLGKVAKPEEGLHLQ